MGTRRRVRCQPICALRNITHSSPRFFTQGKVLSLIALLFTFLKGPFRGPQPSSKWITCIFENPNNLPYFLQGYIWSFSFRFILNANSRHNTVFPQRRLLTWRPGELCPILWFFWLSFLKSRVLEAQKSKIRTLCERPCVPVVPRDTHKPCGAAWERLRGLPPVILGFQGSFQFQGH